MLLGVCNQNRNRRRYVGTAETAQAKNIGAQGLYRAFLGNVNLGGTVCPFGRAKSLKNLLYHSRFNSHMFDMGFMSQVSDLWLM